MPDREEPIPIHLLDGGTLVRIMRVKEAIWRNRMTVRKDNGEEIQIENRHGRWYEVKAPPASEG